MNGQPAAATHTLPARFAHLRRDRRGLPVPYINRWGIEEDATRLSIRRDPWVGEPGIYMDDEGQDVPDFTRQNMGRQRECMARGLCQVCGRPVPWSRRVLVISDMSMSYVTVDGIPGPVPVVTEPWLDDECADFAVSRCPALIRRRRDENLHTVRVTSPRDVELVVSRGWVDGPLEVETRRVMPAMWVKLLLVGDQRARRWA